jgi:hypothetical protein
MGASRHVPHGTLWRSRLAMGRSFPEALTAGERTRRLSLAQALSWQFCDGWRLSRNGASFWLALPKTSHQPRIRSCVSVAVCEASPMGRALLSPLFDMSAAETWMAIALATPTVTPKVGSRLDIGANTVMNLPSWSISVPVREDVFTLCRGAGLVLPMSLSYTAICGADTILGFILFRHISSGVVFICHQDIYRRTSAVSIIFPAASLNSSGSRTQCISWSAVSAGCRSLVAAHTHTPESRGTSSTLSPAIPYG